ncbi:Uncharacterised protein [Vibrio cholerae]|nr:Uncharacterised protein [Vibrio cholerae]CSC49533.1 Uncharacterised protein [Vibrio cholerae]
MPSFASLLKIGTKKRSSEANGKPDIGCGLV